MFSKVSLLAVGINYSHRVVTAAGLQVSELVKNWIAQLEVKAGIYKQD